MQTLSMMMLCYYFSQLFLMMPTVAGMENYSRSDFPDDFVFGSGTSALQYEGAAFEDGRTPSIWDTFAHSGHTGGANGDIACDGYHNYKEDVGLMVETGLEAFRFSISWSRLIPYGRGPINSKGLLYYNNFINELIARGIQPHVTLYHLDLPQALEDDYNGWLSRKIVKDFVEFADVCFREFGDRVLHWTTINEANVATLGGYSDGFFAPGRCSSRAICEKGDSATEPYTVLHNMLLSHSAAAKLYKQKYKKVQNGYIGINVLAAGFFPYTNSSNDVIAAKRAHDFFVGWILSPLVFGDYPDTLRKRVQKRLPAFTKQEADEVKSSFDFIGLNHYLTEFVKDNPDLQKDTLNFSADMALDLILYDAPEDEYPVTPWGLREVLNYFKQVYGNPPIYVHENGQVTKRNGTLNDITRVEYLQAYIGEVLVAVRNGSNVKGYFEWSFLDTMEIFGGWNTSFGLYYVDLDDKELTRYQKLSALWYSDFLKKSKSITPDAIINQAKIDAAGALSHV